MPQAMSALSPEDVRSMRQMALDAPYRDLASPEALADRWSALHDRAAELAALAQLSPEPITGPISDFPSEIEEGSQWQRELAWQGILDIEAMMRPGLAALATITARGGVAHAPALALWREFYTARQSLMALARRERQAQLNAA